jgi:hypothetical protein
MRRSQPRRPAGHRRRRDCGVRSSARRSVISLSSALTRPRATESTVQSVPSTTLGTAMPSPMRVNQHGVFLES